MLATTGMRIGEALGLKWKRFHAGEYSHVVVADTFTKGRWKSCPKNRKPREVPLQTWIADLLAAMRTGDVEIEDPIFASSIPGKPLDAHNAHARKLKPAARAIGLPWVDWHSLRHTWASLADELGLSDAQRMKMLGHSSMQMTHRYTHASMEQIREKLSKMKKPSDSTLVLPRNSHVN